MKKIFFILVALVAAMSINAQVLRIYKNGTVVATYTSVQMDSISFASAVIGTGTAKRTGNIDVTWTQLWANGPKFAEYNVDATAATECGGYYCWGSTIDKDPSAAYKSGNDALTGSDDTATTLWGSNWRMPTQAEFQALLDNCDVEWTSVSGVNGRKFTGRGDFSFNSVFFPASGYWDHGYVDQQGESGAYRSSTPGETSDRSQCLNFHSTSQWVDENDYRDYGYSVRAVLAE